MQIRPQTANSITVAELRQALAGKDDNTPVLLYDDMLDTYFPIFRVRAAKVMQDANNFIINAPQEFPNMGRLAVAVMA